jgi:hypothetical protein
VVHTKRPEAEVPLQQEQIKPTKTIIPKGRPSSEFLKETNAFIEKHRISPYKNVNTYELLRELSEERELERTRKKSEMKN